MTAEYKGILISAILGYLKDKIVTSNKGLCGQNLWDQQKPFDAGEMFFKLAFMSDDDLKIIATEILG